ncbi:MAG: hypothetical protein WCH43_09595, partial [Verrucomicrobiota bacterium]
MKIHSSAVFPVILAVCGSFAFAQTPAPVSVPATTVVPAPGKKEADPPQKPASTTRESVDSLSEADLQEVINLLKSNYLNPDALSGPELERATVEGLILRLAPGISILQAQPAGATGTSPFRGEVLDDRIGYLRLGLLSKGTVGELDAA